ncbi:MAG TPA: SDR family oxidoreductase [Acidimicrobiia bacterium]|nr:SDR family oxidoreductase [Acidimicrobiia bacterium]
MNAVVTGAATGIGRAIARRFAAEGMTLLLADVSARLGEVVAELEGGGAEVAAAQVDLTTVAGQEEVRLLVKSAGTLGALINNAGITRDARLVNLSDDAFAAVLDVNLGATFQLTTELIPLLDDGGAVVNLASRAYLGNFGQYNYSVSKGGVVGMTRALALELAPRVRVNAIAPGLIGTEMTMAIPAEVREKMVAAVPLGRMGTPEEVADLAAFLVSDSSSYLTGEVIVIGGGRSLA